VKTRKSKLNPFVPKIGSSIWNMNSEHAPANMGLSKKDNSVFTFIQSSGQGTVLSSSSTVATFGAKSWTAADIFQFGSFNQVFDQYKIDLIEVWLEPSGSALVPGYNGNVKIFSVIDYDDANVPTSVAQLQQYENCTSARCTDGHYHPFKPHIAVAVYNGAFTGFLNKPCDWIDVASSSVQHYGFKYGIDVSIGSGDVRLDMHTRITVSFRNVF
jgi:hypothetical protein